jgi:thiol:disulfide interchange protein DsbD
MTWRLMAAVAVLAAPHSVVAQLPEFPGLGVRPGTAPGAGMVSSGGPLTASAVPSVLEVPPGEGFHLALQLTIASGWIYYSPDPGPVVMAGGVDVDAPHLSVGQALWPADVRHTTAGGGETLVNHVYEHQAVVYVPLTVPEGTPDGEYRIAVSPTGQICSDVCVRIEGVRAATSVRVAGRRVANPEWSGALAAGLAAAMTPEQITASHAGGKVQAPRPSAGMETGGMTVWAGLALALLAGLTLNIMPCVLPVVPIRVLSIVAMAKESRRRFVTLGLAFAGGIVLFFVALAAVSLAVRLATGQAVNVSEHFSYPTVRIALALIVVALAVNLFGAFTVVVPSRIAAVEAGPREGHPKSLAMGFMMAVLATPCSFAYLLAAMAWAQVQTPMLGTLAIVMVGVGMAAPHALLCAFPGLVDRLPAPGRWMELFKQGMGFLLLPVAVWLIGTLGEGTWPFWVAAYCVVLATALWMWGSWVRYDAPPARKLLVRGAALALAVGGGLWMLPRPAPPATTFRPFDAAKIEEARATGTVVLVKVTASWCTECIILEHTVYDDPAIARAIARRDVLAMKADVSDSSSVASAWVRREIGGSPPMAVVYPAGGGPPKVLVGLFDELTLLEAMDQAAGAGAE